MIGTLVNAGAIIIGALIGTLLRRGIGQKLGDTVMAGIGLCVLFIGIKGSLAGKSALVLIVSMVLGGIVGHLCDLDGRIGRLGDRIQERARKRGSSSPVSQAFVTATLLYCVGAMAIVGPIESGMAGDHTTLFIKALLDGITAVIFASQLGFGVALSAIPVLVYQGAIALLSGLIAPYMSEVVIAETSCIGYVLIIGIGLNMLKITRLKLMNYVPGIIICALLCVAVERLPAVYAFLYA